MATVEITQRTLADLERLFDFIVAGNPQKARAQILSVRKAFDSWAITRYLGESPRMGGENSYSLAAATDTSKYRPLSAEDIVLILAVRHQLEAGYAGE